MNMTKPPNAERMAQRIKTQRRQIRELQKSLEMWKSIANAWLFETMWLRESARSERQSDFLAKKTQDQIYEELKQRFDKHTEFEVVRKKK